MMKLLAVLVLATIFSRGEGQTCGGELTATASLKTFTTPNHPYSYTNNLNCVWIISSQIEGAQIEAQFGKIDIEAGGDFVRVRDGDNAEAQVLLVPLTGEINTTFNFVSSFGSLYITFTSDESIVGTGFSVQYRIIPDLTSCGGSHTLNTVGTRIFSSPGFPSKYPNNRYCEWKFTAPPGMQVQVTIYNHQLETCCDSVIVRDGSQMTSKLIGYVFGESLKDLIYRSSTGVLVVRFRSDTTANYIGFIAGAKAVIIPPGLLPTPALPYNMECSESLTTPAIGHGNFTSPEFPNTHPAGVSCSWVIRSPPGTQVHVWFGYVDTETCCDWIKVRDGSEPTSTKLGLVSGSKNRFYSYVSTSNVVRVEFDSDSTYNKRGFRAYYEVHRPGALASESSTYNLTATPSVQYFSSPGFPDMSYPVSVKLSWTIRAPFGTNVQIHFLALNVEDRWDSIRVYDGLTAADKLLVRITGKFYQIITVTSSSNGARVELHSDSTTAHGGFRASYKWVPKGGEIEPK